MILLTLNEHPTRKTREVIGLVRGNAVRSRHLGKDISAFFKNLVGGELQEYTKLLAESREQAMDRLAAEASDMGADAVLCMRFSSSQISSGAAEILAYGTAVKLDP